MAILTITLPDEAVDWLRKEIEELNYNSPEDFIREMIVKEYDSRDFCDVFLQSRPDFDLTTMTERDVREIIEGARDLALNRRRPKKYNA